jgi:hypothetical protein
LDKPIFHPIIHIEELIIGFFESFNEASCDGFLVKAKKSSFRVRYNSFLSLVLEAPGQFFYQGFAE